MEIGEEVTGKRLLSPSTRRAWIEMSLLMYQKQIKQTVALHPEGVDRNMAVYSCSVMLAMRSPSTRRAWIEIQFYCAWT